ncbi:MAG: hypothetical protein WBN10_19380 [Polyangiales bacterium]
MTHVPSKKRFFLAFYLDYLVFTAFSAPAAWLILQATGFETGWLIHFAVFVVVEWATIRLVGSSPGSWMLGIERGDGPPRVLARIKTTERWWTMLLGVGSVLSGAKAMVRWTEGQPAFPFFGLQSEPAAIAVTTIVGAAVLSAGVLVLRCRWEGALLGIGVSVLQSIAIVLGRPYVEDWMVRAMTHRRQLRGQEPPTLEQMQDMETVFAVVLVVFGTLTILLLLASFVRFRRAGNLGRRAFPD